MYSWFGSFRHPFDTYIFNYSYIYPYVWRINSGVKADFERLLFYGVADSEWGRGTVNTRDCHETRESLFLNWVHQLIIAFSFLPPLQISMQSHVWEPLWRLAPSLWFGWRGFLGWLGLKRLLIGGQGGALLKGWLLLSKMDEQAVWIVSKKPFMRQKCKRLPAIFALLA